MKSMKLTKQNYIGLSMMFGILAIGVIGGYGGKEWAENIYTFLSTLLMIIFMGAALVKSKFKPIKQFMAIYFIHVLFCVSLGWWWLMLWWLVTCVSAGVAMNYYLESLKGAVEGEAKG